MKDIASGMKLVRVEKGENVFHHGDSGDKLYFLIKGVASIKIPFGLDNKQIVARYMKFRDVSIDQSNQREFRESQINKDYREKTNLFENFGRLQQWYEKEFIPKEMRAREAKKINDAFMIRDQLS